MYHTTARPLTWDQAKNAARVRPMATMTARMLVGSRSQVSFLRTWTMMLVSTTRTPTMLRMTDQSKMLSMYISSLCFYPTRVRSLMLTAAVTALPWPMTARSPDSSSTV